MEIFLYAGRSLVAPGRTVPLPAEEASRRGWSNGARPRQKRADDLRRRIEERKSEPDGPARRGLYSWRGARGRPRREPAAVGAALDALGRPGSIKTRSRPRPSWPATSRCRPWRTPRRRRAGAGVINKAVRNLARSSIPGRRAGRFPAADAGARSPVSMGAMTPRDAKALQDYVASPRGRFFGRFQRADPELSGLRPQAKRTRPSPRSSSGPASGPAPLDALGPVRRRRPPVRTTGVTSIGGAGRGPWARQLAARPASEAVRATHAMDDGPRPTASRSGC